ncbi:MAG: hypothetical protein WB791_03480 [Waddliaceae bacterium]
MNPVHFFGQSFGQLHAALHGERSISLTFSDLAHASEHHNQWIHIRGFLYRRENGDWMIAKEPDLKTCCLGSRKKLFDQMPIYGDLRAGPHKHAVTVMGRLDALPTWDHEGKLVDLFHLKEAKILPEQGGKARGFVWIALATAAIGMVLVFLLTRVFTST